MGDTTVTNTCATCRTPLDESPGTPVEDRRPCPTCGSSSRHLELSVTSTLNVYGMIGLKARDAGSRKPFREVKSGYELYAETGEWRKVHRVIDRAGNQYNEVIRSAEGEVIREVHERLSDHRDRGAARRRSTKGDRQPRRETPPATGDG